MLRRSGHNRTVDWYLLGVLLYEMLVGVPPYFSSNREELFENIQKAQLKLPRSMSEEAKHLIKSVDSNIQYSSYTYAHKVTKQESSKKTRS